VNGVGSLVISEPGSATAAEPMIRDEITAQMGRRADDLDVHVLRGAEPPTGQLQR
jgi:hypothetical protein